jgi:Tfp pilus assembly major pilin PilA
MPDPLPRWLLVLTGIVALVAIYVGIKDYVERKNRTAAATTQIVADSNPTVRHNKATSAKARRAQLSANASPTAQVAANDMDSTLMSEEFANTSTNGIFGPGNGLNTLIGQAAHDELEAATDPDNRVRNELHSFAAPGALGCLPLPNLTKPGDVDAPYYANWAREYCGASALLIRP